MNYSEIKQKETKRQNQKKKVHQKVKLDCVYPH